MNRLKSILTILVLSSLILIVCGNKSENADFTVRPDSVVYKHTKQADLKLYFHYPEDWKPNDKRPVIVFFFGGGWNGGTTKQFLPQAEYLSSRGMIAVRADYRVKSRHGTWPHQCVEDGKSAVRWIRQNADIIGGDPDMIVSSGGSAGGHVAICTYVADGLEAEGEDHSVSSKPNLLVLFNPVLKTSNSPQHFFSEEMATRISPYDQLDNSLPPTIIFFGTADQLGNEAYPCLVKSDSLNLDMRLWLAVDQKHGFFNRSPWLESTIYLTDKFLNEQGYLEGEPSIELPSDGIMELYKPK
ncbi:alpha/beta hydrolase [Bacteroidota bacterium]